jgi:hypothetical protein
VGFCKAGPGLLLADAFDRELEDFPDRTSRPRVGGGTLLMVADFGGSHAGQLFETYSFLVLDLDQNHAWLSAQKHFRAHVIRSSRRMSFKDLNDRIRRNAFLPFLQMGNEISGWLVTFAVSKNGISLFGTGPRDTEVEEALARWKPAVQERLLRILHLSGFLLSGLSSTSQDVLWLIDQDEIAANVDQLTQLTKLFGVVVSNCLTHDLGHLRCGTAKSDDGTRSLEDILAYCDLAAGSVCEIATAMAGGHRHLQKDIVAPLPSSVSWKTRVMTSWLADRSTYLHRMTCLIDLSESKPSMSMRMLRWHALPGTVITGAAGSEYEAR